MTDLLDTPDGKDLTHITTGPHDLDPNLGPLLNHLVTVIRVLRRRGIGVELDIRWDELAEYQSAEFSSQKKPVLNHT